MKLVQQSLRIVAACLVAVSLVTTTTVFASTSRMFLTPEKQQPLPIGTEFEVKAIGFPNPDTQIGNASGTIKYDAGILRAVSVSTSGSHYSPTTSIGSDSVTFNGSCNRCNDQSTPSMKQILTIKFRAVGAGTGRVWFDSNSRINNAATEYGNATFPVYNPNPPATQSPKPSPPKATTPPASSKPTPSTSPSPSPTPEEETTQPTPDPTGLIDNVSVQPLYTSGSVSWLVTASNPKSTFRYGERSADLSRSATPTKDQDGRFTVSMDTLIPGKRYYFSIDATGDGNKQGAYSGTLTTTGFPVVLVVNENETSVKSAQATIGSRTYNISNGKIAISLAAGKYTGKVTTATASLPIEFTVESKSIPGDGSRPETQTFTYNLTSSALQGGPGSGMTLFAFVGVMVVGLIIIGFGFVGFMAYRRRQFENASSSPSASPTVIIEDGYDYSKSNQSTPPVYAPPDEKRD